MAGGAPALQSAGVVSSWSDWGPNSKFGNIRFVVYVLGMGAVCLDPLGVGQNPSGFLGQGVTLVFPVGSWLPFGGAPWQPRPRFPRGLHSPPNRAPPQPIPSFKWAGRWGWRPKGTGACAGWGRGGVPGTTPAPPRKTRGKKT